MDKPYISKRVKVAIVGIDKGLGVSATRALQRLLQRNDANTPEKENDISVSPSSSLPEVEVINFRLVSVEEPTEAVDVATAAQVVADELKEMTSLLPTSGDSGAVVLLLASSRGGKVAGHLLSSGMWRGPTLLLSAMSTAQCCSVEGVALLLAHGVRDGTNPIHRVREDVQSGTPGLIALREFDDDHHLGSISREGVLKELIREVVTMNDRVAACVAAHENEKKLRQPAKKGHLGSGGRMALFSEIISRRKDD